MEKNVKALKRRRYKGFCVFFIIWDSGSTSKIGQKWAKNSIFSRLKAL